MTGESASGRDDEATWHLDSGQSHFLQRHPQGFAPNGPDNAGVPEDLDVAADAECRFEIYRQEEVRMTSTLFAGGDWRWRLVTDDGLVLAEAAGYPNEGVCLAAVSVLQRRAAAAPILTLSGGQE